MRTDKTTQCFRLVLLGQDGVGKSAIAVRFLCGRYLHEYDPNLESCYEKMEPIEGKPTRIEVFDTAGQQTDLEEYLSEADAILYVYSITNRESFDKARLFRDQLFLYGKTHLPVLLMANKRELEQGRRVSFKEGYSLARSSGWKFHETSAAVDSSKLKEKILEFIKEVQAENKKLRHYRRGNYFKRAVSVLSGNHRLTREETSFLQPTGATDWLVAATAGLATIGNGNNNKLLQRRLTCPNL
ncbi:Ras-like protein family member 12 [Holothuria leucospilota]|uniref:small monomeric GTPase n=1 Tax=Holothuria leucospilota TaxID=206669 RepID=A0A9Q1C0R8_HOLLE|nr:Ras-like protein family member 12 [Holothuria leucospilota]